MTIALHQVLPAVAARLGSSHHQDDIGLPVTARYIVILIDGLGWNALQEHADAAPFLATFASDAWRADFPTTTAVGLAALGTGLTVGQHGLVGASFWVPECAVSLSPLHWAAGCSPTIVQPEATVFEQLNRDLITSCAIGEAKYADSGLTRAVLRGARYIPAQGVDGIVAAVVAQAEPVTYVYWAELDRAGHRHGVASDAWRQALALVDSLVNAIAAAVTNCTIIVTADHGMIDVGPEQRIPIDEDPVMRQNIRLIAGEPRMRHIYLHDPHDDRTAETWRTRFGDRVEVWTREDAIDHFAPVGPGIEARIGDLVCIAQDCWVLTSSTDRRVSALTGQHGALTDDEVLIPGIVIAT